MRTLELVKRWTGDGFGDAGARILTQVKRNENVALYHRTVEHDSRNEGYEVFVIKVRHKGDKLPGGLVEQENREVYPSSNSFGKTAWHMNKGAALAKFDELTSNAASIEDSEETGPEITIPFGEFTIGELAEKNSLPYLKASLFVKEATENKTIIFLREERRNVKGKPSKIFSKAA